MFSTCIWSLFKLKTDSREANHILFGFVGGLLFNRVINLTDDYPPHYKKWKTASPKLKLSSAYEEQLWEFWLKRQEKKKHFDS